MLSFAPEIIFKIGKFPVSNTLLDTLLVDIILIGGALYVGKKITSIPSNPVQNISEWVVETFYSLTESVSQNAASKIFPYFITFFLFILFINWSALIPGVGTIGFFHGHELVPLFRGATSDLNTTLGLALVSVAATHVLSIRTIGIKDYLSRYFSFNPINLFIGVLEIISEITKVVSLSFRLFGNIYAGEVVLITVSSIFAFAFPLPFLMLEVIVGIVQALVFSMLTMAFMAILTTSHNKAH
ncbi:MAG: ATP synthase F0 subunit A [Candidatus Levybacteria bacterium RIFCSPLOWO2_01_FULL_39_24]|nr:MAG: ATP synthase F0 subunit A [Candidatus Levybacteria bacterium RIFCSPHIGHO2_01_FULL_40_16]OGH28666.1 MAG: ATP synthase F0 subunit A [Candidatus Levybacteria bacterium RIFCSPHIGHO2_12_FULL_39_9]OGH46428.1 MAG: ATP synthase F0 subunit A [Candidatus Levybacteria bacterium RIFCSPLOWO2_01_FULL_39_24]